MEDNILVMKTPLFVITSIFLVLNYGCCDKSTGSCTPYIKAIKEESSGEATYQFLNLYPMCTKGSMEFYFSEPIDDIQIESSHFETKSVDATHWIVNTKYDLKSKESTDTINFAFKAKYSNNTPEVVRIVVDKTPICEELDEANNLFEKCAKDIEVKPDEVVEQRAVWPTGRNYRITIPAIGNFSGFAVEIFFTNPVDNITTNLGSEPIMVKPTHWVFVKRSTDPACIKLIDFTLQLKYEEESNINAIFLNGKRVFGEGESQLENYNANYEVAKTMDCNRYLKERCNPWFAVGDIAMPLWFDAQLNVKQVGLVVDLVFEREVKEVRVWRLRASRVGDFIWRMQNPAWIVSPERKIFFDFAIYFYDHYHVKVKGIIVNGRILCGLGAQVSYDIEKHPPPEVHLLELHEDTEGASFRMEETILIVNVILTLLIIIVAGIVCPLVLLKMIKKNFIYKGSNYITYYNSSNNSQIYDEIQPPCQSNSSRM